MKNNNNNLMFKKMEGSPKCCICCNTSSRTKFSFLPDYKTDMCPKSLLKVYVTFGHIFMPGLNLIVSSYQTTFVSNRSISENVLLAQELVSDYHKDRFDESI